EQPPQAIDVSHLKVVHRELHFVSQAHVAILYALRPFDVIYALNTLKECNQSLQPVGDFSGNQIQIDAAALLKVSELRDLETIQHHLPADAPGAQRGRLPVILFELDIVL